MRLIGCFQRIVAVSGRPSGCSSRHLFCEMPWPAISCPRGDEYTAKDTGQQHSWISSECHLCGRCQVSCSSYFTAHPDRNQIYRTPPRVPRSSTAERGIRYAITTRYRSRQSFHRMSTSYPTPRHRLHSSRKGKESIHAARY